MRKQQQGEATVAVMAVLLALSLLVLADAQDAVAAAAGTPAPHLLRGEQAARNYWCDHVYKLPLKLLLTVVEIGRSV